MKKKTRIIIGGVAATLLLLGGGGFVVVRSFMPAAEEVINYRAEDNRATIAVQLDGVDRPAVRALAPLILERSVTQLQASVAAAELNYADIMAFYLDRIDTIDQAEGGLNSVASINPHAMAQARAADAAIASGGMPAEPLFGLGVLVKDNINTHDVPTTAGTMALAGFYPAVDAPVVQELTRHGAIVLGKANLSEWANFMSLRMPSGYSSFAGQTFNPFGPGTISPLGSSSGSAVAVSANLAPVALGTETTGSIVAPAAINSVVGFKPTRGTISGDGVVPLASSLDTVGPIARTVRDAAALLNASLPEGKKLSPEFTPDALRGATLAVAPMGDEQWDQRLVEVLEAAGARVVPFVAHTEGLDNVMVLNSEFAADYAEYASRFGAPQATLGDVVRFNQQDSERRARYGMNLLEQAAEHSADPAAVAEMLARGRAAFDDAISGVDAIVFFDNSESLLACLAGAPEITLPFGVDSDNTPHGVTFVTAPGQDVAALLFADAFEQAAAGRVVPQD